MQTTRTIHTWEATQLGYKMQLLTHQPGTRTRSESSADCNVGVNTATFGGQLLFEQDLIYESRTGLLLAICLNPGFRLGLH